MTRPFLTARWQHLLNLTYAVDPALLEPHLPAGVELEREGDHAFASIVAFDFLDTRVLGIPWPGFRDFPELNLRFYVRRENDRGVVFIREMVPQRWVAFLARQLYGEPYVAAPMMTRLETDADRVRFRLDVEWAGRRHVFAIAGRKPAFVPDETSLEHRFKEHVWGWGTHGGETLRYHVDHPEWAIWPVEDWTLDADFELLCGPEWRFLRDAEPVSALFAVGSEVAVYPGTRGA